MPQRRNLTDEQRELIRIMNKDGLSDRYIAEFLGIHRTTVYRVLTPSAAAQNADGDKRRRAEAKKKAQRNSPNQYRSNLVVRAAGRLNRSTGLLERVERGDTLVADRDWLTAYTGGTGRTTRAKDRAIVEADGRLRRSESLERDGTLSTGEATWLADYIAGARQDDIKLLYGSRWMEVAA